MNYSNRMFRAEQYKKCKHAINNLRIYGVFNDKIYDMCLKYKIISYLIEALLKSLHYKRV